MIQITGSQLKLGDVYLGKQVVSITEFSPAEYRRNSIIYKATVFFDDNSSIEIEERQCFLVKRDN